MAFVYESDGCNVSNLYIIVLYVLFVGLYIPFVKSELICLYLNNIRPCNIIGFEGIKYIYRIVAAVIYYCSYA